MIDFINRNLVHVNQESFVTAIYAVYDPAGRKIRIARAAHPRPIFFRPAVGKARELVCEGVSPMGVDLYERVPTTEISLQPGDRLLFYTDGVTERFNPKEETYDEERLCRMMESPQIEDPKPLLDRIVQDLTEFAEGHPADDDQAMLLAILD